MAQDTGPHTRLASGPDVIEDVLARMRERGGRATSARQLLLTVLLASPGHRSADELAAEVQARAPVWPCRQYRYSAPGVATTLYSRSVGVTAGLGVPSTLT